ncbi:MAG: hypothetical protein JHC87_02115 [Thermoleophilaceae bacterium]|nr:hypothetical protein [Thermoleophilaceae bacterium]
MSDAQVKVRFAPSPTGPLHVGSVRTALLNWLFARANGGTVLLRIDDTDRERSTQAWEAEILAGLQTLGLTWDEGPLHQSSRGELYAAALERLPTVRRDDAYEFDGRVIARSDGSALYHLATAVDEIEDGITHVLRGRDHLSNTELQSSIITALGAEPPVYVHAPLLLGDDGSKLSKRASSDSQWTETSVGGLLAAGVPGAAICNALALSLAEFGGEEVMATLDQMAANFDLARLHTADSQFDPDKLKWLSGQHIRLLSADQFAAALKPFTDGSDLPPLVLEAAQTAAPTLSGCAEAAAALLAPPEADAIARQMLEEPAASAILALAGKVLGDMPTGDLELAKQRFAELKAEFKANDVAIGKGLRTLRAALSGRTDGPELPYVLALSSPARLRSLCAEDD